MLPSGGGLKKGYRLKMRNCGYDISRSVAARKAKGPYIPQSRGRVGLDRPSAAFRSLLSVSSRGVCIPGRTRQMSEYVCNSVDSDDTRHDIPKVTSILSI